MQPTEHRWKVQPHVCPACGATLNAVGTLDGKPDWQPKAGDVYICIKCGHALRYADDQGHVRSMTRDDFMDIAHNSPGTLVDLLKAHALITQRNIMRAERN